MEKNNTTRRTFLSATAAFAGGVGPLMGSAAKRVIGANDQIHIGHIGAGGNGSGMLRRIVARSSEQGDVKSVAVCDVYSRHRDRAQKIAGLETKNVYLEYRDLLARDDIDAVMISTPDHWHAPMAIDAMEAGKDVTSRNR